MLDEFAEAKPLATEVSNLWHRWQASVQEIERLQQLIASQDDRKTLLSYQLEEFAALNVAGRIDDSGDRTQASGSGSEHSGAARQVQSSLENWIACVTRPGNRID